jgi:hypothetical protein
MRKFTSFYFLCLFLLCGPSVARSNFYIQVSFQQLNTEQKIEAIATIREFMRQHEQAQKILDEKYSFISPLSLIISDAFAGEKYSCIYGGWPSHLSSGGCIRPTSTARYSAGPCSSQELQCNPALFGGELCIPFSNSAERNSAYANCEKKFKASGRTLKDVVDQVSDEDFQNSMEAVAEVCHNPKLKQSTSGMCQSLKNKFAAFLPTESNDEILNTQKAIDAKNPEDMYQAGAKLTDKIKNLQTSFEKNNCENFTDKNELLCYNLASQIKNSQKIFQDLMGELEICSQQESEAEALSDDVDAVLNKTSCTEAEKIKRDKECSKETACVVASTMLTVATYIPGLIDKVAPESKNCLNKDNSCLYQLMTSAANFIVSTVKDVWHYLGMAWDWAKEKGASAWNYLTGVEDETSKTQSAINNMSEEDIQQVSRNPLQWMKDVGNGFIKMMETYLKEDLLCEKWSGAPHLSECLQPMKEFSCLNCGTMITGICSAGGPTLGEMGMWMVSGGSWNLLSKGAKGAKLAYKSLKATKNYQKLSKSLKNIPVIQSMRKSKSLARVASAGRAAGKFTARATLAALSKLRAGYASLEKTAVFKKASVVLDKIDRSFIVKGRKRAFQAGVDITDWAVGANKTTSTVQQVTSLTSKASNIQNKNYHKDVVSTNSRLSVDNRKITLQQTYKNLKEEQINAILKAHEDIPCKVYKCTQAEILAKKRLMHQQGVPEDVASDAIRRGFAGNSSYSSQDFMKLATNKDDDLVWEVSEILYTKGTPEATTRLFADTLGDLHEAKRTLVGSGAARNVLKEVDEAIKLVEKTAMNKNMNLDDLARVNEKYAATREIQKGAEAQKAALDSQIQKKQVITQEQQLTQTKENIQAALKDYDHSNYGDKVTHRLKEIKDQSLPLKNKMESFNSQISELQQEQTKTQKALAELNALKKQRPDLSLGDEEIKLKNKLYVVESSLKNSQEEITAINSRLASQQTRIQEYKETASKVEQRFQNALAESSEKLRMNKLQNLKESNSKKIQELDLLSQKLSQDKLFPQDYGFTDKKEMQLFLKSQQQRLDESLENLNTFLSSSSN